MATPITSINRLYYSDDYGVYKIDIEDLTGESQFVAERFLDKTTSPSIPTNYVDYISGTFIDGYYNLVLSMSDIEGDPLLVPSIWDKVTWNNFLWDIAQYGDGYGVRIVINEQEINTYADGYSCNKAQMTSDGTLYLINRTFNKIEVYYGANIRSGTDRQPDYIYDGYSTPSLFADGYDIGTINTIHVVDGQSNVLSGGTKIYVGQSIGMSVIDAYDSSTDGYGNGNDNLGTATYCGINGSGATHECIGGTIPNVTDIATDERYGIVFIVTNDGYGDGGLTQATISSYGKIIFMTEETELIPSNDIRKVSKNE